MTDLPELDAEEQRVLGSLLEKQRTVPDTYPLTLNSLRTACNQSNSRDPVVAYDEQTVERVGRRLKDRGLLRIVWSDTGRRTLKYHQVLDEALDLADDERALLTVLLLRGPQAPGELKTRSERLHTFADRHAAEDTLRRMAERGLVRELPRRGGERDNRWTHLLGAEPAPEAPPATTQIATGAERDERVRTSYDAMAATYADRFAGALSGTDTLETWLLARVARHADGGPVVEAGCGPGQVTAYLAEAGADATGIDVSPRMIEEARSRFPDGSYEVGDLRRLMRPTTAEGWAAVVSWYSLIHLASAELPDAIGALARPLAPGGLLVLAVHAGSGVRHRDSWFDIPVDLDVVLHGHEHVVAVVKAAGLVDVEWYLRGPFERWEETTERLYVVARKPARAE